MRNYNSILVVPVTSFAWEIMDTQTFEKNEINNKQGTFSVVLC